MVFEILIYLPSKVFQQLNRPTKQKTAVMSHSSTNCHKNDLVARMSLNDNKAGMQGLDKERINKIIMDNTVGSRFYKNEQKRDQQVQERITRMLSQLKKISQQQRNNALVKADEIFKAIEKSRDLSRTIVHVDMDAFYASVEERDMPELKDKPMAVGGMDMLSTSNYVARRFGVRAAMPGFIAKKLCPELLIVPLNFNKYKEVSKECQAIYTQYDSNFSAMSLDEAYIDITDHLKQRVMMSEEQRTFLYNDKLIPVSDDKCCGTNNKTFGFSAEDVAKEIRFRIHQKTLLTASAGIGPNTMLAKIGSDLNKPNGQTYFKPERDAIMLFIKNLPIRKVGGIGKVSEQLLSALGIKQCGDLYERRADLVLLFSEISCSFFFRSSLGCSATFLESESERKSISNERTFKPISDPDELCKKLSELCDSLVDDLNEKDLQGKTVTLKIKTVDFELHTRSKSSNSAMSKLDEILPVANDLLKQEIKVAQGKLTLRLMGVGMSKLEAFSSNNQATITRFFKDGAESCIAKSKNELLEETESKQEVTYQGANDTVCIKEDLTEAGKINKKSEYLPDDKNDFSAQEQSSNFDKMTTHDKLNGESSCVTNSSESTSIDELSPPNDMTCPICNVVYSAVSFNLQQFNTHVDSCLSRQEIKQIIKEENAYLNNNSTIKKSPVKCNPPKRRKLSKDKFHKIDTFFL